MGVTDLLSGRLAAGEVVIIDGGMGTQLQAEDVPMDTLAWSARANLEQPGVVQRVHEACLRAGAQVIIVNTFAASRAGLEPAGLGGRVAEANAAPVRAALAAREAVGHGPVVVAGSVSSFCPAAMQAPEGSSPPGRRASEDPRFPLRLSATEQNRTSANTLTTRGYDRALRGHDGLQRRRSSC